MQQTRLTAAGTAAGTAVDLAKLGAKAIAVGAIGDDSIADLLVGLLEGYGVDTGGLVRHQGEQTRMSILLVGSDGERHTALVHPGASGMMSCEDVDSDSLAAADVLHVGGADVLGGFATDQLGDLLKGARGAKTITTLDVLGSCDGGTLRGLESVFDKIDYFLPNEHQIRTMTGDDNVEAGARVFLELGVGCVVVTLGGKGSLIVSRDDIAHVPAITVDVIDTTGCGDAFTAGFIIAVSNGCDPSSAAWLGTAAAALVAGGLGSDAGIENLASTLAFCEKHAPSMILPRLAKLHAGDARLPQADAHA